jgi:imidazolonepropionase-like amidohydrolase
MDTDRVRANIERARAAGMYLTPTHITRKFEAMAATANQQFLLDERLELLPPQLREWWQADVNRMRARATSSAGAENDYVELWRMGYRVTRMAVDLGLPVVTGTDSGDSYCFHGSSLHDELRELVAAGLAPAEALRAATLTPAEVLGKSGEHGSVEAGKIADLVLLEKNPLEDIENTRGIAGVFFNGRYFDRAALDAIQKSVASEVR